MRNSIAKWAAGVAALAVAGAMVYTVGRPPTSGRGARAHSLGSSPVSRTNTSTSNSPKSGPGSTQSVKSALFFAQLSGETVDVALKPDAFVEKNLPDDTPPSTAVTVRLPVYPGAVKQGRVQGIDDLGRPMTSALVDGTVYFTSSDSEKQIQAWYTEEFKQLGYSNSSSGSMGGGGRTSRAVGFTKNGSGGNPTQSPEIDLGMMQSSGHTVFKLFVKYLVIPTRSSDTYLPTQGIVKVVLTSGKVTKTETDTEWIQGVIAEVNRLSIDPPGSRSCPAIAGNVYPIHAKFFESGGEMIPVTFTLPCGVRDVIVGNSKAALAGNEALDNQLQKLFPVTPIGK